MQTITAGTGGEKYIPYSERSGAESVVYFTRDLSAAGLVKIFDKVKEVLSGKIAVYRRTTRSQYRTAPLG